MPTLLELLKAKNDRLESVPDKFLSDMLIVQRQVLDEAMAMLGLFDVDGEGKFVLNKKNLQLASELDIKLREALERSEYTEFVTEFAAEFNTQVSFNAAYFREAFPGFKDSELGRQVVLNAQRNTVQLLVNMSPDAEFILPIKQQIELAVVNNASFAETIKAITTNIVGDDANEGKILHYAKQVSHDAFAVADRSYSSAVADEMGAEFFVWSGSAIKTSRPFCIERKGGYFHRKEIEAWGAGRKTGRPGEFDWPQGGAWAGEMEGTDSRTIFSTGGGYNCRHSIMAVSIFAVPEADIRRAIELGFYKPTKAEAELLEL